MPSAFGTRTAAAEVCGTSDGCRAGLPTDPAAAAERSVRWDTHRLTVRRPSAANPPACCMAHRYGECRPGPLQARSRSGGFAPDPAADHRPTLTLPEGTAQADGRRPDPSARLFLR